MKNLIKLYSLLDNNHKKSLLKLAILVIINSIISVIAIASIVPFVSALSDNESFNNDELLIIFSSLFNNEIYENLVVYLAFTVFFLQLVSTFFRILTDYLVFKQTYFFDYKIGSMLVFSYLNKKYKWFMQHNSAEVSKSVLNEVDLITRGGVMPFLQLLSHSLLIIFIFIFLAINHFLMTCIISLFMFLSYFLIFTLIKSKLKSYGKVLIKANEKRFNVIKETFVGIKEVKTNNIEQFQLNKFKAQALTYSKVQTFAEVSTVLPKYFVELVAFAIVFSTIFFLKASSGSFTSALPAISLFLTAAYRVLPSAQAVYNCISKLNYVDAALTNLLDKLSFSSTTINKTKNKNLDFKNISLVGVSFTFPGKKKKFIDNLNLDINKGDSIAFVGKTGSGKTTIVDMISGLIEPDSGFIYCDNLKITKNNIQNWRKSIGYVNQDVYLIDDTIAANVAFGVEKKHIDLNKVKKCLEIACLNEYIENQLENKYFENVGEHGVKLSGGQKQRIGIARALYRDPKILILDEATSALDAGTQLEVVGSIHKYSKNITTITIAHRISTIKNSSKIFLVDNGKIDCYGNYNELSSNSTNFTKLINTK